MTGLMLPARGLITGQGYRPAVTASPLVDPVAEMTEARRKIGKYLDMWEIAYNDILVLKYIPTKIGNLETSTETQNEVRWQNKCGLILKYGPTAKQDGFLYEINDWVYYRSTDGHEVGMKCENDPRIMMCLFLSPAHIIGKIANPDLIW